MNNRHKKRKKKSFDNFLGGYNMKFALFSAIADLCRQN